MMNITKLHPMEIMNSTTTARQEIVKTELSNVSQIPDRITGGGIVQPFYLSNAFVTLILVIVAILLIIIALFLWLQWRMRLQYLQQQAKCELREMNRCRRQQPYSSYPFPSSRQQWYRLREIQSRESKPRIITTMSVPTESTIRATNFLARDNNGKNSSLGPGPVLRIPASSRMTYWKSPGDIQIHCPTKEVAKEISITKVVAPSFDVKLEGQTLRRVAKSLIRIIKSSSGMTMIPLPKKEIKKRYRVQYFSRRTRYEQKRRLRLKQDQIERENRLKLKKWPRRCSCRSIRTNRVGFLCYRRYEYLERKQRRIQRRKKQHHCSQ